MFKKSYLFSVFSDNILSVFVSVFVEVNTSELRLSSPLSFNFVSGLFSVSFSDFISLFIFVFISMCLSLFTFSFISELALNVSFLLSSIIFFVEYNVN